MKKYLPYILFATIATLIMRPFFGHGFLFLLDMSWAPNIQLADFLSNGIGSSFPLVILIKLFSFVLPMDAIQKIVLGLTFFLAGTFMYRFAEQNELSSKWAFTSALFYMINPWTYERFLAGHWLVMLGYAFFPLALTLFLKLIKTPSKIAYWKMTTLLALYPILSLHWAYISYSFLAFAGIVYLSREKKWSLLKSFGFIKNILVTLAVTVAVNAFWLFSFWDTSSVWPKISLNDFKTFATSADPVFGTFFNVLSLYGYWQDIYFLPKDFFSLWWLVSIVILGLSIVGLIKLFKDKKYIVVVFALAFLPILVLIVGMSNVFSAKIVEFLFYILPGFKGLRETAKLGGLIAFFLAFFYAVGAMSLLTFLGEARGKQNQIIKNIAYVLVLALPLLSCYGMFNAFNDQVKTYDYPKGWQVVEEKLVKDESVTQVLFLPWHGYPVLDFAGNKKIANPANSYFSVPIVQGRTLDNVYLPETAQADWDYAVTDLVQGIKTLSEEREFLKEKNISHIILAKIHDYHEYSFLEDSKELEKVFEDDDIVLYRLIRE